MLPGHKILSCAMGIFRELSGPVLTPAWGGLSDPIPVFRVEASTFLGSLSSPVTIYLYQV